jgi:tripartite-type tricarboxylate transporter receptor subunit TctC
MIEDAEVHVRFPLLSNPSICRARGASAAGALHGRAKSCSQGAVMLRNAIILIALGVLLAAPLAGAARADEYPARPIMLVVPYPPGGGNDVIARIVAARMSAALGREIVVENRGGAGGTIATRQVARAAADGYTLLVATSSLAINPSIYANVGYDPRKDFAPIGLMAKSQNVLLVNSSLGVASVGELIARAKAAPGKLTFASTGGGNSVQLAAELFAALAGVALTQIPYRGNAPALTDLLGGQVDMMFSPLPAAVGLVHESRVRALAVTGGTRSPLFPDLPTIAQAGLPGYESELHYGIVAPAGVSRPIVDKLNAALRGALAAPDVAQHFAALGAEVFAGTPEAYASDIASEEAKWSPIVRKAGIKAE